MFVSNLKKYSHYVLEISWLENETGQQMDRWTDGSTDGKPKNIMPLATAVTSAGQGIIK